MVTIENESLKVTIREKGGEMTSLFNKKNNTELLWQADPNVWPWHAPNLFPVVGGLIDDKLMVNGTAYPMSRHGFNRQSELLIIEATEESAKFSLPYSDHTLAQYPFKFDFQIHYDLIDNALRVTYKVINMDDKTINFSVGAHPAFCVPFHPGERFEDYYLEFETDEELHSHQLSAKGFFNGNTQPIALKDTRLYLTHDLFAGDALVFKNIQSRQVSIKSDKHGESISVEFPHFNYLGIWSKAGGNFVCIEPWLGCADTEGHQVDISKKEAIQHLQHGHVFESAFFISI